MFSNPWVIPNNKKNKGQAYSHTALAEDDGWELEEQR